VAVAAWRLGGIPWHRILFHDFSKFHPKEFFGYANNFFGDRSQKFLWKLAWLHHQNHNDHHWGYWVNRGYYEVNELIDMPEVSIREMVADWQAAQRTYTGHWDSQEWLEKNLDNIPLSVPTRITLERILVNELGYRI